MCTKGILLVNHVDAYFIKVFLHIVTDLIQHARAALKEGRSLNRPEPSPDDITNAYANFGDAQATSYTWYYDQSLASEESYHSRWRWMCLSDYTQQHRIPVPPPLPYSPAPGPQAP